MPRWLVWPLFALIVGFVLGGSVFWGLYGPNATIEQANAAYEKQATQQQATGSWMIALLNEHRGSALSVVVCILAMAALVILVGLIWQGRLRGRISYVGFVHFRKYLAIFAALYAIYCGWRLIINVAIPGTLAPNFVPELIFLSIFWVLAPPIWFFVEYFAVESGWISGLPENKTDKAEYLKTIKDYADYASKIWAGVLALLLALIALKK